LLSDHQGEHHSHSPENADIVIGKVVSVNVPRRELRIAPVTSHPERFRLLHQIRLKTREGKILIFTVVGVRVTPKAAIAQVENDDADELAATKGAVVIVRRSERFPLPQNEYYIDDLVGLLVRDHTGRAIGRLREVWHTPANDIYQVVDEQGREVLLPAIEDVIVNIDIELGELTADTSILE